MKHTMLDRAGLLVKEHLYLLSAVLYCFSFPTFDVFPFRIFPIIAWFCLVPAFVNFRRLPLRHVFNRSLLLGILISLFTYGWMYAFGRESASGSIAILFSLVPALAVFFCTKFFLAEYLARKIPKLQLLHASIVWLCIDYIQSIGLLAFPWTYLAYSQFTFLPAAQISAWGGVFSVTFIIVLVNSVLAESIQQYQLKPGTIREFIALNRKSMGILAAVVVLLFAGGVRMLLHRVSDTSTQKLDLVMVQSCISPWEKWSQNKFRYLADLERLTDSAVDDETDMIIWTESATLEPLYYNYTQARPDRFLMQVRQVALKHQRPLLTGEIGILDSIYRDKRYVFNSACLIEPDGTIPANYSKIHICPVGEWFPYQKIFPGIDRFIKEMGGSNFSPGNAPRVFSVKGYNFGVSICYESMFFRLNRYYVRHGADFLVNITNDGWSESYQGHMQHYAASVFRAIENGVWFVRAGNTGKTTILDPVGREQASIPILRQGVLKGNIQPEWKISTLYGIIGDAFFFITMALYFLAVIFVLWRKRHEK